MCEFPSWIETEAGPVFLTDKDCRAAGILNENDCVGHHAIEQVFPGISGSHREGFPCPPEFAAAIQKGKCRKMMLAVGRKAIHLNAEGQLHREDGPAIEWADGVKEWYWAGQRHREDGIA